MVKRMVLEICDLWGNVLDGYLVPHFGGTVLQDYDGNSEYWIGWTNYPAPYWNRWSWTRTTGDGERWSVCEGPFHLWWYGMYP